MQINFKGTNFINAARIFFLTRGPTHSWRNGDARCCQLSNIADPLVTFSLQKSTQTWLFSPSEKQSLQTAGTAAWAQGWIVHQRYLYMYKSLYLSPLLTYTLSILSYISYLSLSWISILYISSSLTLSVSLPLTSSPLSLWLSLSVYLSLSLSLLSVLSLSLSVLSLLLFCD